MRNPNPMFGEPSWELRSDLAEAWTSVRGGHTGPARFRVGDRWVSPYHVAPWHDEEMACEPILQVLRGDFFCLPFGGNATPLDGQTFPVHGHPANDVWKLEASGDSWIEASLDFGAGYADRVTKRVEVREGQTNLYQSHTVALDGRLPAGMHAMLAFASPGIVSSSPYEFAATPPERFEHPELDGYSWLALDARFASISAAPGIDGHPVDLSRYPTLSGFENLAMLVRKPDAELGWTAVVFQEEGYAWFNVKSNEVLPHTVLWCSNGGRHYPPWNGRHRNVLGLEEVCAYFHLGAAESAAPNPISDEGFPTAIDFSRAEPKRIPVISGVVEVPAGFDEVVRIEPEGNGIVLISRNGLQVRTVLDLDWLS